MQSYTELGYMDIDQALLEFGHLYPYHFNYYQGGMITYKKKYIHLYKIN